MEVIGRERESDIKGREVRRSTAKEIEGKRKWKEKNGNLPGGAGTTAFASSQGINH